MDSKRDRGARGQAGHATTALVLSGGGSCGAAQAGMLRELVRFGVRADFIVGTSVGALNGAFFAARPTVQGVAELEQWWRSMRRQDIFPISLRSLLRFLRGRDSLVDPAPVRSLLERLFPFERLEHTQLPVHVVATDVRDGSPVRLSSGPTIESLLASIAIPAVLPPVPLAGRLLMDGGIASNTPVRMALEQGARRIIVLPTTRSYTAGHQPRTAIDFGLHAINLMLTRLSQASGSLASDGVQIDVVPAPEGLPHSPFEFSRCGELIDAAAEVTRNWLWRGGLRGVAGTASAATERPQSAQPLAIGP